MNELLWRVENIAATQHEVVAHWQLLERGWSRDEARAGLRGLRRVFKGVCALGDLTELGWYMAAVLALGPGAALSHSSALMVRGLRPFKPGDIHVSVPGAGGREPRDGLRVHRRRNPFETETWARIPITTPNQSLNDAALLSHELYRALEEAERQRIPLDLPLSEVVRLKQAVKGHTKSDTEARFLMLLHENGFPLPLVNQLLNGYEADFHWPRDRLVVEVDGWKHHREHDQFNEDRGGWSTKPPAGI
jgi:hypothetical protein